LLPGLDLQHWSLLMNQSELYGSQWLLSYEARVRGWLGSVGGGNHVTLDPAFAFLEREGVRFYRQVRPPTLQMVEEFPTWREDYGDEVAVEF
jgi:hypothetical protein